MKNKALSAVWLQSMVTMVTLSLVSSLAHAQAAAIKPCPINPADITKALGVAFADGVAEKNPFGGMSCTYKSKGDAPDFKSNVSIFISQMPMQGSFDNMKMFLGPMTTKYESVAGDADQAMTVVQAPSVPRFPSIVYVRAGQLVNMHIMGGIYDPATRISVVQAGNKKLLALPRVP
ncbi:MAG TPA: hypothetical protein PKC80_06130 [Burkholderiaceae bacterium]|nr:hypothetical protein [Burkholderiaceae bacterium]